MKNILILKFPYSSLMGGGEKHTITVVDELQKKDFNFFLVSSCKVLLKEFRKRHWYYKKLWAGIEPVTKFSVILFLFIAPIIFLDLLLFYFSIEFFKKPRFYISYF